MASVLLLGFGLEESNAQNPGWIYQPAQGAGQDVLNPSRSGYVSEDPGGFILNDVSESEIGYHPLPQLEIEPAGDLRTGPSGGPTDLVDNGQKQTGFMYYDGENLLFRMRTAGPAQNSKGYSVFFNTDFDLFGPKAENYTSSNPGFQFEIVVTKDNVVVNELTGASANSVLTYNVSEHTQRSYAFDAFGEQAYFLDFYIPAADLEPFGFDINTAFRASMGTVTRAQSGITGTLADIMGVNDDNYKDASQALMDIIDSFPPTTINELSEGGGFGPVIAPSNVPRIDLPILVGANEISGYVNEPEGTTINIYKNGSFVGQTTSGGDNTWTFDSSALTIEEGDEIRARSLAPGKELSNNSAPAIVSTEGSPILACLPDNPTTSFTVSGNQTNDRINSVSGTTTGIEADQAEIGIVLYEAGTTNIIQYNGVDVRETISSGATDENLEINAGTDNWTITFGQGNGALPGGDLSIEAVAYRISDLSCEGARSNTLTHPEIEAQKPPAPTINPATYTDEDGAITGTVDENAAEINLYRNGVIVSSTTTFGTPTGGEKSWEVSFTLNAGDEFTAKSREDVVWSDYSNTATVTSAGAADPDPSEPPIILGTYTAGTEKTIEGFSTDGAGTQILLYRVVEGDDDFLVETITAEDNGDFEFTGLTLSAGDEYYATSEGIGLAESDPSNTVVILPVNNDAPSVSSPLSVFDTDMEISGLSGEGIVTIYIDGDAMADFNYSGGTLTINDTDVDNDGEEFIFSDLFTSGAEVQATFTPDGGSESNLSAAVTVEGVDQFDIFVSDSEGNPYDFQDPLFAGTEFYITVRAESSTGELQTGFTGTASLFSAQVPISDGYRVTPAFTGGTVTYAIKVDNGDEEAVIRAVDTQNPMINGETDEFEVLNPDEVVITELVPDFKYAGEGEFTLVVEGIGFVSSTIIRFNGSDRPTNFVNSTEVRATIFESDLETTGTYTVTAFSPPPLGTGEETAPVDFEVLNPPVPTIATVTPDDVDQYDTRDITITGTELIGNEVTEINFISPGGERIGVGDNSIVINSITPNADYTELIVNVSFNDTEDGEYDVEAINSGPEGGTATETNALNVNEVPHAGFAFEPIGTETAGEDFEVTIRAIDNVDDTFTPFTGNVTLTVSVGNISPITVGPFVNGEWSGDISVTKAGSLTITATNAAEGQSQTGTSDAFTVNPGTPSKYLFTLDGLPVDAGDAVEVEVQLADENDNPVALAGRTVSWSVSNQGTGTFSAPTSDTDGDGKATVTFTTNEDADTSHRITANDGEGALGQSSTFTTLDADLAPAYVLITSDARTINAGQTTSSIIIQLFNDEDDPAPATSDITFTLNTTSGSGTFRNLGNTENITTITISEGTSQASFRYRDITSGTPEVSLSDGGEIATGDASQNVTVNPGGIQNFAVRGADGQPIENQTAGQSFEVQVEAFDLYGNTVTGYLGTVDFTTNSTFEEEQTTTSGAFTNGVLDNFEITLTESSDDVTITATRTGGQSEGTSNTFTVFAAGLDNFVWDLSEDSQSNGSAFTGTNTITAIDAFDNVITNFDASANPVTFTLTGDLDDGAISGLSGTNILNNENDFENGVANLADLGIIYTGPAGTGNLVATHDAVSSSESIEIEAGTATKILVETANDGTGSVVGEQTITAGDDLTVYAISRDVSDNFVALVTDDVEWELINISGDIVQGDLDDQEDGSAIFTAARIGTANIEAEFETLDKTPSGTITVEAGDAVAMTMENQPEETVAGQTIAGDPSVLIADGSGNPISGVDVTVSLNQNEFSSAAATQTVTTAANGIAEFDALVIEDADTGYELTFNADAAGVDDVTSNAFEITAAGINITESDVSADPTSTSINTNSTVTVELRDAFENPISGMDGDFTISLAPDANATFDNLAEDGTSGNYTFTVTSTEIEDVTVTINVDGTTLTDDLEISFTAGVPNSFVYTTAPHTITAGNNSDVITIALRDSEGNTTVAGEDGFTFTLNSDGTGEFRNTGDEDEIATIAIAEGESTASFRYYSENSGSQELTVADQNTVDGLGSQDQTITINPAAASKLVITTQPTGGTGSADGTPTTIGDVVLVTQDAFDNPSTAGLDNPQNVTVSVETGTGNLSGTLTRDIQSGTITFDDLTLDNDGDFTLEFTSAGLDAVETDEFTMSDVAGVAPVLSGINDLSDILEDETQSAGDLISDLIDGHLTVKDGASPGVAVVGADFSNGNWEVTIDGGDQWWSIDEAVSGNNATLLYANGDTRIRFVPAANYFGASDITLRGWDRSGGQANRTQGFNITETGGSSAFSSATETASITIIEVNDPPVVLEAGGSNVLRFDGADSYMVINENFGITSSTSFTVEAWVQIEAHNNWQRFFDFGIAQDNRNIFAAFSEANSGQMEFASLNPTNNEKIRILTDDQLPLNRWLHVAVVHDADTDRGYIYWDGELVQDGELFTDVDDLDREINYFFRSHWAQDQYTDGRMRQTRIWTEARSQSQIQLFMNEVIEDPITNLVGNYHLNEGEGTEAADFSGNDFTADLISPVWISEDGFLSGIVTESGTAASKVFWVDDVDNDYEDLVLSAVLSDNPDLLPVGNISFSGTGEERTITVNPVAGETGVATITVRIDDQEDENNTNDYDLRVTVTGGIPASLSLSGSDNELSSGSARTFTANLLNSDGVVVSGGENASLGVEFTKVSGTGTVTNLGTVNAVDGVAELEVEGATAGEISIRAEVVTIDGRSLESDEITFEVISGLVMPVILTPEENDYANSVNADNFTIAGEAVDATEVEVTVTDSQNDEVTATFTVTDDAFSDEIDLSGLQDGPLTITVISKDDLDNESNEASVDIILDTTAPQITAINLVGTPDDDAASVQYEVTFSENITGFDLDGFTLTTTGNATGNIASFSGEDDTYIVTIDELAGVGSIRLDFVHENDDDIEDLAGNAIEADYAGDDVHSVERPGAPDEFSVADATIAQGASLLMNFTGLVDADGNTVEDGDYNIVVSDVLTGTEFTVENVTFTDGEATDMEILDGDATESLTAQVYENITFSIGDASDTADITINQALNTDAGVTLTIGDVSITQGQVVNVTISDIVDLAGNSFDGQATLEFTELNTIVGYSDGNKTFEDQTIADGSVTIELFDADETTDFAVQEEVTLSANIGDASGDFDLTVTAVISASNSSVAVSPSSVIANGQSASTVTITVRDAANNPVGGLESDDFELEFDVAGDASATADFNDFNDAQEADGIYTFQLTNSAVETGDVVVDVDGTELEDTPEVSFTDQVAHAGNSSVSADPLTVIANGDDATTLEISVRDADEVAMTNFSLGDFTITGLSEAEVVDATFSHDGNGVYTVDVTNEDTEQISITVVIGAVTLGTTDPVNFVPGPATRIALTGSTNDLASGDTRTLTATLYDAQDNVVESGVDNDLTITFAKTTGDGTVSGLDDEEAEEGIAEQTVTGVLAGGITLRASTTTDAGTEISDELTFTIIPGDATQLTLEEEPTEVTSGVVFAENQRPVVQLRDAAGNAVSEAAVEITASLTQGDGDLTGTTQVNTDAEGLATFTDLTITGAVGTNYILQFAGVDLGNVTTDPFEVITGLATPTITTPADESFVNIAMADELTVAGTATGAEKVEITITDSGTGEITQEVTVVDNDYTFDFDVSGLEEGELKIEVIGVDAGDNKSASVDVTVTLDLTPPVLTVNGQLTNNPEPTITGTSDQPEDTELTLVIDGETYITTVDEDGNWSVTLTEELTPDGEFVAEASISDEAGNETTATGTITVDTTPPAGYTVSWDTDPVNSNNEENASFTISDGEEDATFNYEITSTGGGTPVTGTGTITDDNEQTITGIDVSGLGDGELTITVTLTDPAGNEGAEATDETNKNTVAPRLTSIERLAPADQLTNANELTYRVTFSEAVTGVASDDFAASGVTGADISVSQESATVYDITISGGNVATFDGTVTLSLNTPDIADSFGNELTDTVATGDVESYTLDNTPPEINSITLVGTPDDDAASIQFQVVFSENITGFNLDGFTLESTGNATGNIASFTGEDDTYVVTVNGIDGLGTLRLDFLHADDEDITDIATNPIVEDFTTGTSHDVERIGGINLANSSVSADPNELAAGTSTTITVTLRDGNNNAITGIAEADFDFDLGADNDATLVAASFEEQANGIYEINVTNTTAEQITVTVSVDEGGAESTEIGSDNVTFVPAAANAANSLIAANPDEITADGDDSSTITVTIRDEFDNIRADGGDDVFLTTSLGALSATTDQEDGTYTATLTGTITGSATITGYLGTDDTGAEIGTTSVTLNPDEASKLVIAPETTDLTAGVRREFTIAREDANENDVADGELSVNLSTESATGEFFAADAGGAAITSIAIPDGSSTISVWYTDTNAAEETPYDITFNGGAGDLTQTASITNVVPNVASQIALTGPGSVTVGNVSTEFTIQVQDEFENPTVTTADTEFDLTSNTAGTATFFADADGDTELAGASITIENGQGTATFYYRDTQVNDGTVVTADRTSGNDLGSDTSEINITDTGATQLALQGLANTLTAGTSTTFTIQIQDGDGIAVPGATDITVDLTSNRGDGLFFLSEKNAGDDLSDAITELSIDQGENDITVWYYATSSQEHTVTIADDASNLTGDTDDITVQPATLANFQIQEDGDEIEDQIAGTPFTITATARDAFNNVITDFDEEITIAVNGSVFSAGQATTFDAPVDGVYTMELSIRNIADNVTLDITRDAVTTTSNTFDIAPRTLTLSDFEASDKVYDRTNTATISSFDNDLIAAAGEDVTATMTAEFDQATVGTGISVDITNITLSGDDADNYTLWTTSVNDATTANITARPLLITGTFDADSRAYDGSNEASFAANNLGLDDVVGGDEVNLDAVIVFAQATVGEAIEVTLDGATAITGAQAGNYTLSMAGAPTSEADITPRVITLTGEFEVEDKAYDGNATTTISENNITFTNVVGGETLGITPVAEFDDENVGEDKPVTLTTDSELTGITAANYEIDYTDAPTTTANITPAAADAIVILTQPENTTAGESVNGAPKVRVEDFGNNPVPNVEVTVSLSSNAFASGTTTVTTNADGEAEFTDLVITTSTDGYTLTFVTPVDITQTSASFNVIPAAPNSDNSTITANPVNLLAGDFGRTSTVTLRLRDAFDNEITTGGADVYLTTTRGRLYVDSAPTVQELFVVPEDNGDGTYTAKQLPSDQVETTTITGYLGTDATGDEIGTREVNFVPDPPVGADLAGPTEMDAGSISTKITLTLVDQLGNPSPVSEDTEFALSSTGTKFFSDEDGEDEITTITVAEDEATAEFYYSTNKAGTQTVTATWQSGDMNLEDTVEEIQILVRTGDLSTEESLVTASSPHTADGDDESTLTITLKDDLGNNLTGLATDITLSGLGNATAGTITEVDETGVYTTSITNTVAETIEVIVTVDGEELDAKATITFEAGTFAQMSVTTQPTSEVAGNDIGPIVLQLQDTEGNNVESDVSVTLSISDDATLVGTLTQNTNASGVVEFTDLYVIEPGEDYIITANSGGVSQDADAITITRRPITITADADQSKIYGEDDPDFEFSVTSGNLIADVDLNGELVRAAGENVGDYEITRGGLTNGNNASYDITFVSNDFEITTRPLILSDFSASDKTYNANDNADISFDDNRINDDDLEFNYTAVFEQIGAGDDITVNITGISISGGDDQNNYDLQTTSGTATANIERRQLLITGDFEAEDRAYDGTTAATFTVNNLGLDDVLGGDDVTLNPVIVFDQAEIGENIEVTLDAATAISGNDADNYELSLTGAHSTTAEITRRVITLDGSFEVDDKVYDGNATATINDNSITLTNVAGGETLDITPVAEFEDEQVGVDKEVTLTTDSELTGATAANYEIDLTGAPVTTATISAATADEIVIITQPELTVAGVQIDGPPVVQVNDFGGNPVEGVQVAVSLNKNAFESGTTTVTTGADGQATFDDLEITTAAEDYVLTFSTTGVDDVESAEFDIVVGVDELSTEESKVAATTPHTADGDDASTLTITLKDQFENNISGLEDDITLTGLGNAVAGDITEDGTTGVYTVSLTNTTAEEITIQVSVDGEVLDEQATIVFNSGAFNQFVYLTQPQDANAGDDIGEIRVQLQDDSNNNVEESDVSVTLSISEEATIVGDLTAQTNASGVAVFDELHVIDPGTDYTVTVTSGGVSEESNAFTISRRPITLAADAQSQVYGGAEEDLSYTITSGSLIANVGLNGEPERDTGSGADNYTINRGGLTNAANPSYDITFETATYQITQRDLTLSNFSADNKEYDGNTDATGVTFNDNRVAGDQLTFTFDAAFDSRHAGNNKQVNITNITLGGDDAGNYNLLSNSGTAQANITRKELTVSNAQVQSRPYDGTDEAEITGAVLNGVIAGDDVSLTNATQGTFDQSSVGDNISVSTAMGLGGDHEGNYTLSQPNGLSAHITQRELTITGDFTVQEKIFDGTTDAEFDENNLELDNVITGDNVSLDAVIAFAQSDVGDDLTVELTAATDISGTDAGNYTLSLTGAPTGTGNIITGLATPVIAVPSENDFINADDASDVTISGTAGGAENARITITDSENADVVTTVAVTDNDFNTQVDLSGLADGNLTIEVIGLDMGDNESDPAERIVILDQTYPELTVDEIITSNTSPTLTGTSDQPEGTEITITITDSDDNPVTDGDDNPITIIVEVDEDGNWEAEIAEPLEPGDYTTTVEVTDEAGNTTVETGLVSITDEIVSASLSSVSADPEELVVSETSVISIVLRDGHDMPVKVDADDFNLTLGENLTGSEINTDEAENGEYTFEITTTVSGVYDVVVSVLDVTLDDQPQVRFLPGDAESFRLVSGNDQSGMVADTLANAIVTGLYDEYDNPIPGMDVRFLINNQPEDAELAAFDEDELVSDAEGLATVLFRLGNRPGAYEIAAVVADMDTLLISATATPGAPTGWVQTSGDGQTGPTRSWAVEELKVYIADIFDNPVPEMEVSFEITGTPEDAEDMELDVIQKVTDEDGVAISKFRFGDRGGAYQVRAFVDSEQNEAELMSADNKPKFTLEPLYFDLVAEQTVPNPTLVDTVNTLVFRGEPDSYAYADYSSTLDLTEDMSIEMWILPHAGADDGELFSQWSDSDNAQESAFRIRIQDGHLVIQISENGGSVREFMVEDFYTFVPPQIANNQSANARLALMNETQNYQWMHLAVTLDSDENELTVYRDGFRVLQEEYSGSLHNYSGETFIGRGFAGEYHEIRVWDQVRSQSEIQALKDLMLSGQDVGLNMYHTFDEEGEEFGDVALDATANENNLMFQNVDRNRSARNVTQIVMYQNEEFIVTLTALDQTGGEVSAEIVQLPANGSLYQIDNLRAADRIEEKPADIADDFNRSMYIPERNFSGTDSLRYRLTDQHGNFVETSLVIEVLEVNRPPVVLSGNRLVFNQRDTVRVALDTLVTDNVYRPADMSWNYAIPSEYTQDEVLARFEQKSKNDGKQNRSKQQKTPSEKQNTVQRNHLDLAGSDLSDTEDVQGRNDEERQAVQAVSTENDTQEEPQYLVTQMEDDNVMVFTTSPLFYRDNIPVALTAFDPEGLSGTDTLWVDVRFVNSAPQRFDLVYPAINDTVDYADVSFAWNRTRDLEGSDIRYNLHVSRSDGAQEIFEDIADTTLVLPKDHDFVEPEMSYTWFVEAFDGLDYTRSNQMWDFRSGENIPDQYSLRPNYPNPFNPSTNIEYWLPVESNVRIEVYDVLGRRVAVLVDEQHLNAGVHTAIWDARRVASGVYFYRIVAVGNEVDARFITTRKMMLIK